MPETTSLSHDNQSQPNARLRIVVPPSDQQLSTLESKSHVEQSEERLGSPPRPSYSPVTPTSSHPSFSEFAANQQQNSSVQWIDDMDSLPVDLDNSSDAIALRAAISTLQIQKQQAKRDMQRLEKMKQSALQDPEAFVEDLKAGKLTSNSQGGIQIDDMDSSDDENNENRENRQGGEFDKSKFGTFPSAQEVVRTPPIEWSKYHVVGEALNRLHDIQRHYPGVTEEMHGVQIQPYEIAAPYRPFTDKPKDFGK